MGNKVGLLSAVKEWCLPLMQDVVHAMYQKDQARSEALLRQASEDLVDSTLSPDENLAAEYLISRQRFAVVRAFCPREEQQLSFTRTLREVGGATLGPASEVTQCIVLIQTMTIGERLGFCEFDSARFHELFGAIPVAERDDMLWHHVATWAFTHWDAPVMALAYENLVIKPTDFRDQYPYHRVNLMHRLITKRATTKDVENFLNRLEIVNEILEFERHILPRIRELGLANNELELLVAQTRQRLEPLQSA